MKTEFSRDVLALFKPIIDAMTRIYQRDQTYPVVGPHNEPPEEKAVKRSCVHIISTGTMADPYNISYNQPNELGSDYTIAVHTTRHGDRVCQACGRRIYAKFDKEAVDTIMKAIEVIDGLLLFGAANGLGAEPLKTLISLKECLPRVAQLQAELNEFVKRDNTAAAANGNLVENYETTDRWGITGYKM